MSNFRTWIWIYVWNILFLNAILNYTVYVRDTVDGRMDRFLHTDSTIAVIVSFCRTFLALTQIGLNAWTWTNVWTLVYIIICIYIYSYMEHWTCKIYEHKQVLCYLFVLYFLIRWVLWLAFYGLGHPAHVKPLPLVSPGTSSICQRNRLNSPLERGRMGLLLERGAVLSTELQLSTGFLQVHRALNSGSSMWKESQDKGKREEMAAKAHIEKPWSCIRVYHIL